MESTPTLRNSAQSGASGANVIICVCARMASKRLPGKALLDVGGKPAIWWPLSRASRTGLPVYLCTTEAPEDDALAEAAADMGFYVYQGPEHVARRMLGAADAFRADHVIRVTGDDIFADPDLMVRALGMHFIEGSDWTTMPAVSRGWDSEILSRRALELAANFEEPELLGLILPKLPINRLLTALSTPFKPNMEINTPEDLERARAYISANAEGLEVSS